MLGLLPAVAPLKLEWWQLQQLGAEPLDAGANVRAQAGAVAATLPASCGAESSSEQLRTRLARLPGGTAPTKSSLLKALPLVQ